MPVAVPSFHAVLLALFLLAGPAPAAAAQAAGRMSPKLTTAAAVVERLIQNNQERDRRLALYQVERTYRIENELSAKVAVVKVLATYRSPDTLQFGILAQAGSGFLTNLILKRILQAEEDAEKPEAKRRNSLTPENYDFVLQGQELLEQRPAYVLQVTPKREETFLVQGRIWVDAEDFSLLRVQGTLSKRPSFWTRKIEITRTFKDVGPFRLPDKIESTVEVLLFGTTWVTVTNGNYRIRLQTDGAPPQRE